jgi:hypothetical protein
MNASKDRLFRRRAWAAIAAAPSLFAFACNLLVGVPDPVPLSAPDASVPPAEAGAILADVSASEAAVSPGDARSEETSAADSSPDAADASPDSPDAADASPSAADASPDAPDACDASGDDDENCGWCGHSCGGAPCQSGLCQPTTLVSAPDNTYQGIYALLIASNQLYFTNWNGGPPMYRLDLATGARVGFGPDAGFGATLSRAGNTIFYGQVYTWNGGTATDLYALDVDAGAPVRVLQAAPDVLGSVKEDGVDIFYTTASQGLFRTPLSPGAPDGSSLADQLVAGAQIDFDVLGNTLYVAASGRVFSLPKSADASTQPVPLYLFGEPHGVTAAGSDLYWYDSAAQTINRGAQNGTSSTVLATLPGSPQGMVVDDVSVYVEVGPSIMAVDKDGTRLRTYAKWAPSTAQDVATAVTFDDAYVYWGRSIAAPSSVLRVPK